METEEEEGRAGIKTPAFRAKNRKGKKVKVLCLEFGANLGRGMSRTDRIWALFRPKKDRTYVIRNIFFCTHTSSALSAFSLVAVCSNMKSEARPLRTTSSEEKMRRTLPRLLLFENGNTYVRFFEPSL